MHPFERTENLVVNFRLSLYDVTDMLAYHGSAESEAPRMVRADALGLPSADQCEALLYRGRAETQTTD